MVLAFAVTAVLFAGPARALDPDMGIDGYSFEVFRAPHHLPQGSVFQMARTSDGRLWIGTLIGVARFDGVKFEGMNTGSARTLGSREIKSLQPARDGGLWIGTFSGLYRYRKGVFLGPSSVVGRNAVESIAEPDDGTLIVSVAGRGVHVIPSDRLPGEKHEFAPGPARALGAFGDARALLWSRERRLWLGARTGLLVWDPSREEHPAEVVGGVQIWSLWEDGDGGIWATSDAGLVRVEGGRVSRSPPPMACPRVR